MKVRRRPAAPAVAQPAPLLPEPATAAVPVAPPSSISDQTWSELEAWLRTRDPYDASNPNNWVTVPNGFATFRHMLLPHWEKIHKYDHLRPVVLVHEIAEDEIEIEPDPLAPMQD